MAHTLHQKVTALLLARIRSGDWPVGTRLPAEVVLASELGVSRTTLRVGLSELEKLGLVTRRKRVGTTVTATDPRNLVQQVTGGVEQLLDIARNSVLDIVAMEDMRGEGVAVLDGLSSETGFWLCVTGTRRIIGQEQPFNWTQVYVVGRYAGIRPVLGASPHAVYTAVEEAFGVSVARIAQTVSARTCPPDAAKHLGLRPSDPVLNICARLYDAHDALIEVSDAYYDPEKFTVATDVRIA